MPVRLKNAVELYRGDDIKKAIRLKDKATDDYIDLTGWTGTSQLRVTTGSPSVAGSFTVTIPDQLEETGRIYLIMPSVESAELPLGKLAWDVQMITSGLEKLTVLYGIMEVVEDVTRP